MKEKPEIECMNQLKPTIKQLIQTVSLNVIRFGILDFFLFKKIDT